MRDQYNMDVASSSRHPLFAEVLVQLDMSDIDSASQSLLAALKGIALDTGMKQTCPGASQRTGRRFQPCSKPWVYLECQSLKAEVRQVLARRAPAEEMRPLRRASNAWIRRKRRAFLRQRLRELLGELKDSPKKYWDAFFAWPKHLPECLWHLAV